MTQNNTEQAPISMETFFKTFVLERAKAMKPFRATLLWVRMRNELYCLDPPLTLLESVRRGKKR